jgi:hypothetical protein
MLPTVFWSEYHESCALRDWTQSTQVNDDTCTWDGGGAAAAGERYWSSLFYYKCFTSRLRTLRTDHDL